MNRDRAKELLPIITAFANGEEIQCRWSDFPDENWYSTTLIPAAQDGSRPVEYRIKPKPITRPWSKPEDVPGPVCWIRKIDTERFRVLVVAVRPDGIRCSLADDATQLLDWDQLDGREHSTDCKTWHPCTVTEEA